ncbi:cell division protein SepF [Christensenella timonensis]|uniref:cell division protein SepF n=1 Tax=Christensenella timonensis TaxID=1816678 RepID=UPI00082B329D|nr:cell division protein SepF [Christensenella timonensis]
MGKMGDKLLSFIGLEPTDEEVDDRYYDEQDDLQDDMMGFPEDDFVPPVEEKKVKKRGETAKVVGIPDTSKVRVLIYKPVSYEDTQSIIDHLKEKKPIIVNLDELDTDVAQRILDFVSGAVYALNGNIRKAARNIFVVAPYNVDVSTNTAEAATDEFGFSYLERE